MTQPTPQLDSPGLSRVLGFVRSSRTIALRRTVWVTMGDLVLLIGLLGLVAAGLTGWTLRGDLARPMTLVLSIGLSVLLLVRRARLAARDWGSILGAARSIARHDGPLAGRTPSARVQTHRRLRREILGCLELVFGADPRFSRDLARVYVDDVAGRIASWGASPKWAAPPPRLRLRASLASSLAIALGLAVASPAVLAGAALLLAGQDARPAPPASRAWSTLRLDLTYPSYTRRAPRVVSNPSGRMRVVPGTEITVSLTSSEPAASGQLVFRENGADPDASPPLQVVDLAPSDGTRTSWTGTFVVAAGGSWSVFLLDRPDDPRANARRRSDPMPIEVDADRLPEIELTPTAREVAGGRDRDHVDVEFTARDDFGIASLELVYEGPEGIAGRLPIPVPTPAPRQRTDRFTWPVSDLPVTDRSEIVYWLEVRDNDPGLGRVPLADPPGKKTKSTTMRLIVQDEQGEHTRNIVRLVEIRDAAVDLLAQRMTTELIDPGQGLGSRVRAARQVLASAAALLATLSSAVESTALDLLSHESDARILAQIHGRLFTSHRAELDLHRTIPPGALPPRREVERGLAALARHNGLEVTGLEDEIIRLDDLVDGQILALIETLVARLEATQRRLVDELERLRAGDGSARDRIEQIQMRRRDDMRRLAEARAMLPHDVDGEFFNKDALAVLERMERDQDLERMLREGNVDQALERMRAQLGQLGQTRDHIQERLGTGASGQTELSPEERRRMQLLRELSRLQDEERTVGTETTPLHQAWRGPAGELEARPASTRRADRGAQSTLRALESVNDARLGRDARRALDVARRRLEDLRRSAQRPEIGDLELAELSKQALRELQKAIDGSDAKDRSGQTLRNTGRDLERLHHALQAPLPDTDEVLSEEQQARIVALEDAQSSLRQSTRELAQGELATAFGPEGRKAMRDVDRSMEAAERSLSERQLDDALDHQRAVGDALQRAIDSLRQGSPPPPATPAGPISTEAERDRSLRDALLDAMRAGTPTGFDEPVKRYYEELLR